MDLFDGAGRRLANHGRYHGYSVFHQGSMVIPMCAGNVLSVLILESPVYIK